MSRTLFSFAHNSCYRNHQRYTLCGAHYAEGHAGRWQDCPHCRELFETEMYVYYGTNEYNFEKLAKPPKYDPTRCAGCKGMGLPGKWKDREDMKDSTTWVRQMREQEWSR